MVYGSVLYTSGAVGVLKQEALVSTNLCSLSKGLCPGIKENKDLSLLKLFHSHLLFQDDYFPDSQK